MRSVVKHSYVKGAQKGARARAHVDYIQYRSGEDREKEPRSFFDDKRENFHGREVKQEIDKRSGKVIHKLILSPGVEGDAGSAGNAIGAAFVISGAAPRNTAACRANS